MEQYTYLFYGTQTYAIEKAIQKQIHEIENKQSEMKKGTDVHKFSVSDFFNENNSFATFQDYFFTPPFSGNSQIFYIKELEILCKQKNLPVSFKNLTREHITPNKNNMAKNNLAISFIYFLTQALLKENIKENNNFILLQANLKDLNEFPLFFQKILQEKATRRYYKTFSKTEELTAWIKKKLELEKIQLSGEQTQLLLYFCGDDVYNLDREIEKLSLLKRKIETEDITRLVSHSQSYQIFSLLQDIIAKNQSKALDGLNYFLIKSPNRDNTQRIFSLLSGELQKLLKVKWLLNEEYKTNEIANLLKLPNWLTTKLVRMAKNLKTQEIENALLFLHSNDLVFKYAAKNSEHLITQFCIQWMKGYFLKRAK